MTHKKKKLDIFSIKGINIEINRKSNITPFSAILKYNKGMQILRIMKQTLAILFFTHTSLFASSNKRLLKFIILSP